MQPFCFNPSTNRETLRDFNERVQEFCLESGAVNIVAEASGKYLILKVFTPDDQEWPEDLAEGIPTVMPAIRVLDAKDPDWEEQISALMQAEEEKATDEDPVRQVIDVRTVQNGHDSTKAWAIVIIVTGEVDPNEQQEPENADEDSEGPLTGGDGISFQPNASRS